VVEPGTVLLNSAVNEQNMAVGCLKGEMTNAGTYRPAEVMVLADNQAHTFLLQAYCLDYAKKAPSQGRGLAVASKDKRVARILASAAGLQASEWASQLAIWMDRSGITPERATQIYPGKITKVDIEVAKKLLVKVETTAAREIPGGLPRDVRVEVSRLYSTDPATRNAAAEVLGRMGARAREAVPFILENILDRTTDRPLPPSVSSVDAEAANDDDRDVNAGAAVERLQSLDLPWLEPLISSLGETIAESGDGGQLRLNIPGLPPGLKIRAPGVEIGEGSIRIEGAGGLLGAGATRPTNYIERLQDEDPNVRRRAAWLLGTQHDQQAVEPLIRALEDPDAGVRAAAAEALAVITGKDLGEDAQKWKLWLQDRNANLPQPSTNSASQPPVPEDASPSESTTKPETVPPPEIEIPPSATN
jgi:hypothetical protein